MNKVIVIVVVLTGVLIGLTVLACWGEFEFDSSNTYFRFYKWGITDVRPEAGDTKPTIEQKDSEGNTASEYKEIYTKEITTTAVQKKKTQKVNPQEQLKAISLKKIIDHNVKAAQNNPDDEYTVVHNIDNVMQQDTIAEMINYLNSKGKHIKMMVDSLQEFGLDGVSEDTKNTLTELLQEQQSP